MCLESTNRNDGHPQVSEQQPGSGNQSQAGSEGEDGKGEGYRVLTKPVWCNFMAEDIFAN